MIKSIRCNVRGTVQGVGFRPWVYRLALQLNLKGFVRNTSQGVNIEIEGEETNLNDFAHLIRTDPPVHCAITQCLITDILPQGFHQFQILASQDDHQHEAIVLPDIATCGDCLKEIFDKNDRRYLYPFTNCTHCGPRYSIIRSLPYDRINTSMNDFIMCDECQKEYDDPLNRRFHAQPNACPHCGPQVVLWDDQGQIVATARETLPTVVKLIKRGDVVAIKSLGGFLLLADALNDDAVSLLRKRKARPHKPLALMMPSVKMTSQFCTLNPLEIELLQSPQAPIVLLAKAQEGLMVSDHVAFNNPYLGCMLPTMPLQHILLRMINRPLVATSGNLNEEPICIDNTEALNRLKGIADFFLVHDRPIVRHVDDSIAQVVCDGPSLIRRARGYSPLPIEIGNNCDGFLATGAHQKNTVALGLGTSAVLSQHIGDLDNQISCRAFEDTISSLKSIYDAPVIKVVCDSHPDYASSRYARSLGVDVMEIQHHFAHVASCMAEQGITQEVLGICWDGTGYGDDGTVWGGEFLLTDGISYQRIGHLKAFALPGGELAVKEPRRSALGLLFNFCGGNWEEYNDLPCIKSFSAQELRIIRRMIEQKINSPWTSSMGRLYDGISSLIGLCHKTTFEAQAAMAMEFQITEKYILAPYYYETVPEDYKNGVRCINWSSMVKEIIEDIREGKNAMIISTRFHLTLIEIIVDIAHQMNRSNIVLTGGCFQNKWLIENTVYRLRKEGFDPFWQTQVPANDGGISLGQMFIASRRVKDVSGNSGKS